MKNFGFSLVGLILLLTIFLPDSSYAKKAEMILVPTRIVLGEGEKYATLTIKNSGDAVGQYKIDVIDMIMQEDGVVREIKPDEKPQYSGKSMVKISPKSTTIKPDQSQTVRILIKAPDNLEEGEYRSHIKVKLVNDNADDSDEIKDSEVAIKIKTNISAIIPILYRQGKTIFKSSITDAELIENDDKSKSSISLYLHNEGNRSSMGDFKIYTVSNGEEKEISNFNGVPVYRGIEKRKVIIPVETTEKTDLKHASLKIKYFAQEKDGSGLLAEADVKN